MTDYNTSLDLVARLVKQFHTNRPAYHAPEYKEADARQELIDPLFVALGWDVHNDLHVAPQYRQVIPEKSLDVEGQKKAPDYAALTTRLKLQGAVLLQPLTPEQIDRYLAGMGDELVAVQHALGHDPALQELAQSPLMLSIMTLAYRGATVQDLAPGTTEARRKHLFDAYLRQMFKRRSTNRPYSPEQTTHWLAWLAQQMVQRAQTAFLIERMQPDWLQTVPRWQFAVITGLILGLSDGLSGGLMVGLVFGLSVGLLFGLLVGLSNVGSTEPTKKLEWSWEGARTGLMVWLIFRLRGGLSNVGSIEPTEKLDWS